MSEYGTKIYRKQGGDELVVEAGGKITKAGVQAGAITKLEAEATNAQIVAAINAIIDALQGVGIIA